MTTTVTDLRDLEPFDRRTAIEIGAVAYRRLIDELRTLEPADWGRDTDCESWTVRHLIGHVGGMMTTASTLRALMKEQAQVAVRSKRSGVAPIDVMSSIQLTRVAHLSTDELIEHMDAMVEAAIAGRSRPSERFAELAKFRVVMGSIDEKWTLGYLLGTIMTRDTWLHRVSDLARAVDRAPHLDADHDGRIVADVAAEWARRHAQPVELVLTGPAGGHFVAGTGGPTITLDAIEFCRMLSGRAEPTHDLLTTEVPF